MAKKDKSNVKNSCAITREISGDERSAYGIKQFLLNRQFIDDKVSMANASKALLLKG